MVTNFGLYQQRSNMRKTAFLLILCLLCSVESLGSPALSADIVVYGGTASGVTAALGVVQGDAQLKVILLVANKNIGGMVSGKKYFDVTDSLRSICRRIRTHRCW
jgi:hypothetical protein